jgi:hypothetical protein
MIRSFATFALITGLLFSQGTLMGGKLLNQDLSAAELAIQHGLTALHQTEPQETHAEQEEDIQEKN